MKKDYWLPKINNMFYLYEDSYKTEQRPQALWYLLSQKYPELKDKKRSIEIIKDIEYVSRLMRRATEQKQNELKAKLEREYIQNIYGNNKKKS